MHLSGGFDLENHSVSELTITPFPAAADAAMLSAATKLSSGEDTVGYKEIKEKADLYAKCKKHLTESKKLSDEDADKHLEAAKDEELTAMGADEDGRQKSLADEKVAADKKVADEKESELKRMANLSGQKTKMIEFSKGLKAASMEKV